MGIEEILAASTGDQIKDAVESIRKAALTKKEDVDKFKKQYKPSGHDVLDEGLRPDKQIKDNNGRVTGTEKVNRLPIPLQKKVVNSMVSFTFGNPVELQCEPATDGEKSVLKAVKRILFDNKTPTFNRKVARELARCTEVAELWFPVEVDKHNTYGFDTPFKLRVVMLSPWNGDALYPLFDGTGDMVAICREYKAKNAEGKEITRMDIYTKDKSLKWVQDGDSWTVEKSEVNIIGKIPIVYGKQEEVEWADVQYCIERLEKLLSNFGDTNDYHAAPKIFIEGKVLGFAKKGESGGIIEGEPGSKASYLSWQHAPESVKLEIETLLRFIYSFTQTPDISFDSVKGLQAISGEALKMLFMDAHLKVQDKREIFDDYLQRRLSIIKTFVGGFDKKLATDAENLMIVPEIVPYIIKSDKEEVETLTAANGNKPLISHEESVRRAGLTEKPEEDFLKIQKEQQEAAKADIFNPTE